MKFDYAIIYPIFLIFTKLPCQASPQGEIMTIMEDPTCPCLRDMTHLATPKSRNDTCLDVPIVSKTNKTLSIYCYPPSHGTTCASNDNNLAPYCNGSDNKPEFCDAPFCYVDPSKCKLSKNNTYKQSSYFPNLYYSYTTCGSNDRWREFQIKDQLKGATLRVGVPAQYYPDHFKLDADGNPILWNLDINAGVGEFQGIYIELLTKIALFAGFTIQYESVSANAREQHAGTWDACIQDVGLGILDMCVGDFWETMERRERVQFTTAIYNELFYMRVPKPRNDDSFLAAIQKLFQPFTPSLWLTIVLAIIVVGLSYTILDSNRKTTRSEMPEIIMESLYAATMELMNGAENKDKPMYYKIVTVVWSFFVLIIIAAYTANLAAFLSQKKAIHEIISMDDCEAKDCNLCHESSKVLSTKIKKQYSSLENALDVDMNHIEDIPQALSNGTCDVFLQSKQMWDFNKKYWGNCETMWLGDFVLSFKVAMPVSLAYSEAMSYYVGRSVESGEFDTALRRYEPNPRCIESKDSNNADKSTEQLGVKSMAGPLVILGMGIFLAMFCKFVKYSKKHRKAVSVPKVDKCSIKCRSSMTVVEVNMDSGKESLVYY